MEKELYRDDCISSLALSSSLWQGNETMSTAGGSQGDLREHAGASWRLHQLLLVWYPQCNTQLLLIYQIYPQCNNSEQANSQPQQKSRLQRLSQRTCWCSGASYIINSTCCCWPPDSTAPAAADSTAPAPSLDHPQSQFDSYLRNWISQPSWIG